jgi:hypothetical protein
MPSITDLLPMFTANLAIELAASVTADINTHWMQQRTGSPGVLAGPVSPTDTTVTLTLEAGGGLGFVALSPGSTIVIDSEPMSVTAVDNAQITVTRNVGPMGAGQPAPSHETGTAAYLLRYRDPWVMIADEALRPWAQQIVSSLGAHSATFGARTTGFLSIPTAPTS